MKFLNRRRQQGDVLRNVERNVRLDRGLIAEQRLRGELYSVTSVAELCIFATLGTLIAAIGLYFGVVADAPPMWARIVSVLATSLGISFMAASFFAFFYGRRSQERMLFAIASESANTTHRICLWKDLKMFFQN